MARTRGLSPGEKLSVRPTTYDLRFAGLDNRSSPAQGPPWRQSRLPQHPGPPPPQPWRPVRQLPRPVPLAGSRPTGSMNPNCALPAEQ